LRRAPAPRWALLLASLLAFACRQREQRSQGGAQPLAPSASVFSSVTLPSVPSLPAPADCAEPPADAVRLASGVATRVLTPGRGSERAADNDVVTIEHSVWKRDGSFVDSTQLSGQPLVQSLRTLVGPLRQVVAQMAVGETRLAWLPGHPGGDAANAASSPPATIQVTLLQLVKAPATPRDLDPPPASAKRRASGLAYQLLAKGHGSPELHPDWQATVELLQSVWSSDGKLVESTAMAKAPALYGPRDLLPGLREGVGLMRVGDKMRFWLPAKLAYGEHPRQGRPGGALVADVELLAVR
jgi:peptidylprolyl isomerase